MGKKAVRLYNGFVCKKCANGFLNRRQSAYVFDGIVFFLVGVGLDQILNVGTFVPGIYFPGAAVGLGILLQLLYDALFFMKDGFRGKSLGRLIAGITVIDEESRQPIGFVQSLKRNLILMVPVIPLVVAFTEIHGKRLGDGWAKTRVIWDKYRHAFPFEDRGHFCQGCGYDLTGNTSGTCPECGAEARPPMAAPAWPTAPTAA